MAGSIGEAWIDVGLNFKKAEEQAKKLPPGIKDAFAGSEKKYVSSLKEGDKLQDERISKMHELLGVTKNVAAIESQRVAKMSFLDKTMSGMGAKIGKGGMMGAQLSYAAQDFVTGLSMGNLNMALMGASNNLGMMAMQISSAAAAWTTLGLVSIPLALTAFKAFGSLEDKEAARLEHFNKMFERRRFSIEMDAKAREKLTDLEVKRMKGAEGIGRHVEEEEKGLKGLNGLMEDNIKHVDELNEKRNKGEIVGTLNNNKDLADYFKKIDAELKNAEARHIRPADATVEHMVAARKKVLEQMGIDEKGQTITANPLGGLTARSKLTDDMKKKAEEDVLSINKKILEIKQEIENRESDIAKLKKQQAQEATKEVNFMTRLAAAGENTFARRRIEIDKHETDEEQRIKRMGLEKIAAHPPMTDEEYEKKKKAVEDKAISEEENRQNRIDATRKSQSKIGRFLSSKQSAAFDSELKDILARRAAGLGALDAQRAGGPGNLQTPALKAAAQDAALQRKRLQEDESRFRMRSYTGLVSKLDPDSGRRLHIRDELSDQISEIQKMNISDAEKRHRIKLAGAGAMKELGEIGPRTSFSGIADLSRQMQMNITSNPMQAQIAAATKGVQNNTQQMLATINAMIQNGLKVIGGGAVP